MRFLKEHVSCYKLIRNRFSQSFPSNQISDVRAALIRWWIEENWRLVLTEAIDLDVNRCYRHLTAEENKSTIESAFDWWIDWLSGKKETSQEFVTFLNYLCKLWVQTIEGKVLSIAFLKVLWLCRLQIFFTFNLSISIFSLKLKLFTQNVCFPSKLFLDYLASTNGFAESMNP